MDIKNFSCIGKAVLKRSVGLLENYKKIEIENGKEKIVYINEINRFGYAKRLKMLPLKLFLLYHHLPIDVIGIIKDISISELAEYLNCDTRSILAANDLLVEYGYIRYSNGQEPNKYINIFLPEYKEYFASAHNGGRGYLVTSKKMLDELCKINNIISLRVYIRALVENDDLSLTPDYDGILTISFKRLHMLLADYCKRNVIVSNISSIKCDIFHVAIHSDCITFKIKDEYKAKIIKKEKVSKSTAYFVNAIDEFNNAAKTIYNSMQNKNEFSVIDQSIINDSIRMIDHFKMITNDNLRNAAALLSTTYKSFMPVDNTLSLNPITITQTDINDLAGIALQYNDNIVFESLSTIYRQYINRDVKINSLGALVRTNIVKNITGASTSKITA